MLTIAPPRSQGALPGFLLTSQRALDKWIGLPVRTGLVSWLWITQGLVNACQFVQFPADLMHITVYIYIYFPNLIRYVYSIDHVTCSTYVCICAAAILAILVLLATFELTE